MEINNRTVRILQLPKAYPLREMWMMSEENFDLQLKENEFIVKNEFIFLDDKTLEYLNKESSKILNKVMFAITFGKVLESKNVNYVKNDVVIGNGGVQDYCITNEKNCKNSLIEGWWIDAGTPERIIEREEKLA